MSFLDSPRSGVSRRLRMENYSIKSQELGQGGSSAPLLKKEVQRPETLADAGAGECLALESLRLQVFVVGASVQNGSRRLQKFFPIWKSLRSRERASESDKTRTEREREREGERERGRAKK